MQWIISRLALLAAGMVLMTSLAHAQRETPTLGVWVWGAEAVDKEQEAKDLVDFCKKYGFTRVLLQIHFERNTSPAKIANEEGLKRLLHLAGEAGIFVEALDGASEMALASERKHVFDHLDAVLAFEASLPAGERFSAIHYDIEPYTLAQWKGTPAEARTIAREMLETFSLMRDRIHGEFPDLPLKFDIPAWYDTRMDLALDFHGKTKLLNEHIQDIADEVVIMSYRRKANGHNSAEELAANELAYAGKTGKKVGLALETIPLKEDPQISFFDTPEEQFRATVHQLYMDLDKQPGFGGVYLHHYDRLKVYLQSQEPLVSAEK